MEPEDVKGGYEPKLGFINPNDPPKFRDPSTLPPEALTDPDYAIKQLQKFAEELNPGIKFDAALCSRCHHCR